MIELFKQTSCFAFAAGKNATEDGSVIVARSEDAHGTLSQRIIVNPRMKPTEKTIKFSWGTEVPQVKETYGYVSISIFSEGEPIEENMGGINEFQVCAGASSGGPAPELVKRVAPVKKTTIGDYRMTFALQRAKTAREAVKVVAELTEKYGARTDHYILADPQEAWLWEESHANNWIAVRVPDDSFVLEPNTHTIGEVDLDDGKNVIASPDLIPFAEEHGLYDPDGGEPFNFRKVYGVYPKRGKDQVAGIPWPWYNLRRWWRAHKLLAPSYDGDPCALEHPTFMKAERKLAPRDFIQVMRDHYQGTKYDLYGVEQSQYKYELRGLRMNENRQYQLAPIWNKERLPGTSANDSWVAQLRDWMPDEVGGLLWGGFAGAHACAHIPWYVGIRETPKAYNVATVQPPSGPGERSWSEYDKGSAYWAFINVFDLVNLFYQKTIDEVQPVWEEWEEKLFKLQPAIEEVALELYGKDPELAVDFLTSYSNAKGQEAFEMAKTMVGKLLTIIAHHNTPWF